MSKLFSKTVKKTTLWAAIIAIVLAAGIVVCALFGFNKDVAIKDKKTLTVSLNAYVYNTQADSVKADLLEELNAEYALKGAMSGDVSEIVFVFDKNADVNALKATAESYFEDKIANEEGWAGAKYSVSAATENATISLAKAYVVRVVIACVVLAVLAYAYVACRYKLAAGIVAGASVLLGMLLTTALIVVSRVYVTSSVAYAIAVSGLLTAVMTLFTLNNVRAEKSASEEEVASAVAVKEVLYAAAVVAVGMIVVGILGKESGIWFAVSAVLAVVASAFVSLFFAPAAYLCTKTWLDSKVVKEGYVGAKKTSTKEKKAPVAAVATEAPAEEAVEEEVVEETAEEAVAEEVSEEVVEEAVVEETPAEEPVTEEVAEEKTED